MPLISKTGGALSSVVSGATKSLVVLKTGGGISMLKANAIEEFSLPAGIDEWILSTILTDAILIGDPTIDKPVLFKTRVR